MALVLTLRDGDFVFIGPDITIAINRKKSQQLRIAIEAPKEVLISTSNYARKKQKKEELK